MKSSYSIDIEAKPEHVFHWMDDAQRVMQWVPNLIENEDLQITPEKVGSTFRQVYLENGRRMEMFGVVTAHEPNRRIRVEITGTSFDLDVDYRLDDLGGRTRVTQDTEVSFKGFLKVIGVIMMPLLKKSSQKQQEDSFAKLKQLSEAEQNG